MKHCCIIFCVLLIITCAVLSDSSRENTISSAQDGGNKIKGCLGGGRTKRGIISKSITLGAAAIKGLRARQKLLKGLTPVKKEGPATFYNKNVGVTQMFQDFYAVNPTNVQPVKANGITVGRRDRIGDTMISYDTRTPAAIFIFKIKQNGAVTSHAIIYGKNIIKM